MIRSGLRVALLRSIGGHDEVPFGLASGKLTLFPGSSATSRAMDSEYLSWDDFFFHG